MAKYIRKDLNATEANLLPFFLLDPSIKKREPYYSNRKTFMRKSVLEDLSLCLIP